MRIFACLSATLVGEIKNYKEIVINKYDTKIIFLKAFLKSFYNFFFIDMKFVKTILQPAIRNKIIVISL